MFLLEPILTIAYEKLAHDPADVVPKVKERFFQLLEKNRIRVVSNLTRQEIEASLRTFGKGGDGAAELTSVFSTACEGIDPATIYGKWDDEVERVLSEKDYVAGLRLYKIKGLPAEAGSAFGLRYQDQVMRWLRGKEAEAFITVLREVIPNIPQRAE